MGGGDNCPTVDICPDLILAGLAAAGAAAFFFIYQAITVKAGRRKRRSFQNFITSYDFDHVIDFFIAGKFYIIVIHTTRKPFSTQFQSREPVIFFLSSSNTINNFYMVLVENGYI